MHGGKLRADRGVTLGGGSQKIAHINATYGYICVYTFSVKHITNVGAGLPAMTENQSRK